MSSSGRSAVGQSDEIEVAVAVEVGGREGGVDVLAEGRLQGGDRVDGEVAGAVVLQREGLARAARGEDDVEVEVAVEVEELEVEGPGDEGLRAERELGLAVAEVAVAVAEPQAQRATDVVGVAERWMDAPVGGEDVEVTVAVEVAELEIADVAGRAGEDVVADEGAVVVEEEVALPVEVDADDEVGVAVAVDVAGLDDIGVVGFFEDAGPLAEALALVVAQQLIGLGVGVAAGGAAAAVGEDEVDEAVGVEVDELDLLRHALDSGQQAGWIDLPGRRGGGRGDDCEEPCEQERATRHGDLRGHCRWVLRAGWRASTSIAGQIASVPSATEAYLDAWRTDEPERQKHRIARREGLDRHKSAVSREESRRLRAYRARKPGASSWGRSEKSAVRPLDALLHV
ncbi:hypothetical protein OV203_22330 [Nannocystis sp. ILAH1]|uniref:hypothetical protein n=1 Tax=unclassified Nannocystis TaxID=2627009 RepID=UPI002270FDF8|nr:MULTISPECIES: hypothetical protein [unclassified Nannocystis]MCY0989893.1 hypothetical protein [Nannocystis sp. ILAH1]MCY1071071.1 hypothetical protein [Nannocystis sp. RBIL2]